MSEKLGIIEVAGLKGSGKTTYIINKLANMKTLILYSKPFPIINILKHYNINNSDCELVNHEISCKKCLFLSKIKLKFVHDVYVLQHIIENLDPEEFNQLVIDTFDTMCITYNYIEIRTIIFNIMKKLKVLCFRHDINVFILNECYTKELDYNYALKNEGKYLVNVKIKIVKIHNLIQFELINYGRGFSKKWMTKSLK